MNAEPRALTLDPDLMAAVHAQVAAWNEELLNPWIPSPAAKGIAQTVRNSCPRMAEALDAAGILEPWAEMLHDRILNLALENRRHRGLSPSEAESEARKDLIPWCWEMQEEWLAAHCIDYEPGTDPDPDIYIPEDDDEPDDDCPACIPRLKFEPGESYVVQNKLVEAVNAVLKHRNLSSGDLMKLGAFLWLVERLPEHHDKYHGKIDITSDYGDGAGWRSVTISGDGLALDEGEIIRGECGTDHESQSVFRVSETCGSDSDLYFDLEDWLRGFVNDAGDPGVDFSVEWYPDNEMPTSEVTRCEPEPRYQASSVAWAIACLGFPDGPDISPESWRISELVDGGKFGEWLKDKIAESADYESPNFQPDSLQASEAAAASAEEEWQATMTMETLTKKQQQSLQAQVDAEYLPSDISHAVSLLMPYGACDDGEDAESGDGEDAPQFEL